MLYDTELFVPATPELLRSITRNRDHSAVFVAAHDAIKLPSVDGREEVYPTPVTKNEADAVFYPFYEGLNHPTDALITIIDGAGEVLGWKVTVWYNDDDVPGDDDYEDPEFD